MDDTEIFEDKVTWSILKDDVKEKLYRTGILVFKSHLDDSGKIAIIEIMVSRETVYIFRIDLLGYIPKLILKSLKNPYIMKVGFNLAQEERRFDRIGWPIITKLELSDMAPNISLRELMEIVNPRTRVVDNIPIVYNWPLELSPDQVEYLKFQVKACHDIVRYFAGISEDRDATFVDLSRFKENL